jgi:aspartate/methionine/tyrosine aminotransferase
VFSSRLPGRLDPNPFSRAVAAARASGTRLLDLTETNPTVVGLTYPPDLMDVLAAPESLRYEPTPLGHRRAREAIAALAGAGVRADRVCLTASTSDAYSLIFKILCDPGDEVLVPRPSYPLFDLLTGLEAVRPVGYRLDLHGGWCLDRRSVEAALSPRTRAVLVVSPNNPTGSRLRDDDRAWLVAVAADRQVAIIADEVFADYPLQASVPARSLAGEPGALVFTLGGLSKSAGLPQLKIAWAIVSGPDGLVESAMTRLEIAADTYLSVSTPVQRAAVRLIEAGRDIRRQIGRRLVSNLRALRTIVAGEPSLTLLEPEGGWSAVLRLPAVLSEEAWIRRLLAAAVIAHPGYFFDFDEEAFLIVSLIPDPEVFAEGANRIARVVEDART